MSDSPLMLSVSGARGIIGQSMTPTLATRFAMTFGRWLIEQSGQASPAVVVGRDSRQSGPMIEHAVVAGLLSVGCAVTRVGLASTPGVAIMIDDLHAQGGMVITASHNPIEWNGLKPLIAPGIAPAPEQAAQIIERFHADDATLVDVHGLQPVKDDRRLIEIHTQRIAEHVDVQAIRRAKLKVVLDSVHGVGGPETLALLEHLGVECVHLYGEPTGAFAHTPEPLAENLTELCAQVPAHGAHIGLAQDPDADRLALVDEAGCYLGEEYTLALCAKHVLGPDELAVANLSTSRMIDDIAERAGARVHRTAVGEANVAHAMREQGASVGGEGNGGIIWPRVGLVRDSLAGIALVLEMLARTGYTVSELAGGIPSYAIVKEKLPAERELIEQLDERMTRAFGDEKIDRQDGVRVDWADRWVHVRASNTEPIVRLIAEAGDQAQARELLGRVRTALGLS